MKQEHEGQKNVNLLKYEFSQEMGLNADAYQLNENEKNNKK